MPSFRIFYSTKALLLVLIFFIMSTTSMLSAKSEYKYSYLPKQVHQNQVFPVTVICISECTKEMPKFTFNKKSNVQPMSSKPLSVRNGDDSFYTFYFKALNNDMKIPELYISNKNTKLTLNSHTIMLQDLEEKDNFSGVLAADMKIKSSQVSNYDEKNHLVTLSIEAFEANLEDMYLNNVIDSGIEELKRVNAKVEAEFYFVLPAIEKSIQFTYYNTIKKQHVSLQTQIELADATVTTQTDLNPKEDSFDILKKYSFMFLLSFFLLMFLLKRDFFYLVLAVISLITLLTFYIPHKKVCVKQGAPLYILPTQTSTISSKINNEINTMQLAKRDNYTKIEYKNGIIGWVKNEDICEN